MADPEQNQPLLTDAEEGVHHRRDPDHADHDHGHGHHPGPDVRPSAEWVDHHPPAEWVDHHSPAARRRRVVLQALAWLRPAHLFELLQRFLYCFMPQLIRTYFFDDPAPKGKSFPTSYLNGLRGLTAVKVYTFHYFMVFTDATHVPYGDERHRYITELPIIRYFWTGFTSHIFFGLAGYLTCQRLFVLLDKNDQASQAKVLMSVSGSLFRRAFRLYLPVFLITLLMATYIHLGFYEANRPLLRDWGRLFPGVWNETKPDMYPTWFEQLQFWAWEMYHLCNFVSIETFYPLHDQHLWSILCEMRASLHLHGIIVALAQVKSTYRLFWLWVLMFMYMWWDHWEIWVYILGAIVAQMDLMLTERQKSAKEGSLPAVAMTPGPHNDPEKDVADDDTDDTASRPPTLLDSFRSFHLFRPSHYGYRPIASKVRRFTGPVAYSAARIAGFIVAFYLLSFPILGGSDPCPGFQFLADIIPQYMDRKDKFYSNIGTFILLFLLVRSDPNNSTWRRLLSHWLPQYLGKISFAFYLVQEILQHAFGFLLPHYIWWSFGVEGIDVGVLAWLPVVLIGWACTLVVTLWAADFWCREVEGRCIRFVKWLESVCFR